MLHKRYSKATGNAPLFSAALNGTVVKTECINIRNICHYTFGGTVKRCTTS
jgi:hypothetical protein